MPAWPTRALLLICSILSTPVGQPGHEVTLHRVQRADEEGRAASTSKIPNALCIELQPSTAVTRQPFRKQPIIQVLDDQNGEWTHHDGKGKWRMLAKRFKPHMPPLMGETEVDVDGKGKAHFWNLTVNGVSTRYQIIFHLLTSSIPQSNVTSQEFSVYAHEYQLRKPNVITKDNEKSFKFNIEVESRENHVLAKLNTMWEYNVTVKNIDIFNGGTLEGNNTQGTFSEQPFAMTDLAFSRWAYHLQITITARPVRDENWVISVDSNPFNLLPKIKILGTRPYILVVLINGTIDEANANEEALLTSFINTFGVREKLTLIWNFPTLIQGTTKIEWGVQGGFKKVKSFANSFWTRAKREETFTANGITWALQDWMQFAADGTTLKPWYGQDKPPVEGQHYIGKWPLMHVVLIFVIVVLILPVIFLLIIWRKRERSMREQYEARLTAESEPEPPKRKRKNKRKDGNDNTGFISEQSMTSNTSTGANIRPNPNSNPPIFTIEEHSTFQGNKSTFSPTDGLPPARFRWSAPEKSDMVELTMAQLREQHRALIEQGTGFSFSRYRNIVQQQQQQQQQQLQANQLAQGKPVSAPIVPTGSEQWPTARSQIMVTSASDKVPNKSTGVAIESKKEEMFLPSALPEPQ